MRRTAEIQSSVQTACALDEFYAVSSQALLVFSISMFPDCHSVTVAQIQPSPPIKLT